MHFNFDTFLFYFGDYGMDFPLNLLKYSVGPTNPLVGIYVIFFLFLKEKSNLLYFEN